MVDQQIKIIDEQDPYSRIPKSLIQDSNLRLPTRMVLIMMLSVPPDWDFSIRGMAKIAKVTKDTMSKMLGELEDAGYVKRIEQARSEAGQFAKAGYLVSGRPIFAADSSDRPKNYDTGDGGDEPCPNLPYTAEPYTENSPQINNKQINNKQESNTPYSPPEGDGGAPPAGDPKPKRKRKPPEPYRPDWFESFWKIYPRKDGKKAAQKAWDKLRPTYEVCVLMVAALEKAKGSRDWLKEGGAYIPYASTWINGERWEDQGIDVSQLPQGAQETVRGWVEDPEVIT